MKYILSLFFLFSSFIYSSDIQYFPATVWYENDLMFLYFGTTFIIIDDYHHVSDEYLNQGITD